MRGTICRTSDLLLRSEPIGQKNPEISLFRLGFGDRVREILFRVPVMTVSTPILLSIAVLFVAMTAVGIYPVLRLIRIHEARHELKRGSASFLRSLAGWSVIALWIGATWFFATIIGDWWATDDLAGAVDRAMLRLYVLLEILAALAASD